MPVRTARSGVDLHLTYRRARGSNGSIRAHRASSSHGVVMRDRLPVGHAKAPRREKKDKS